MSAYTYIKAFAEALVADTDLRDACIAAYGRGLQVQVDAHPNKPLTNEDTPWIQLVAWDPAELGPVVDMISNPIMITAGVSASNADANPTLPNIVTERTETASGLLVWGRAEEAEKLLLAAIAIIKGVSLDNSLASSFEVTSNGWLFYPMQVATTLLTVKASNTF